MGLLSGVKAQPSLPAVDIKRAAAFYREKLGLDVEIGEDEQYALVLCGGGTDIFLYIREATKADHTVVNFSVEDIDMVVDELKANGVTFEIYEMDGATWDGSVACFGEGGPKGVWLKDSEGNIVGIFQF